MAIAGQIEYVVSVNTKALKSGLDEAKKEASKFSDYLGIIGKTGAKMFAGTLVAGAVAGAGAIAGLGVSAVKAYADFEQLEGGIKKLFAETDEEIATFEEIYGKSWDELTSSVEGFSTTADEVMANAQNAFKTAGMSANQYMEIVSGFSASLMQSTKNSYQSMEVADMAIQDMADNANTFGTSMESIQNAYQGFAKQNYTMLDNLKLGYGGTKKEMERLLEDATKLTGVKYDISNLDDVFEAIHAIQVEAGIAGTTAKEAMGTISGSLNMAKSAWQNLIVGMADDGANFDQLVDNFVDSIGVFSKQVIPRIGTAIKGAVKAIGAIVPELVKQLPDLIKQLLPAIMEATKTLVVALVQSFPVILQVLVESVPMIVEAIYQIIGELMNALPQILTALVQIVLAIAQALVAPENLQILLSACVQLLWSLIDAIPQIITALAIALPDIITSLIAFLTDPDTILKLTEASIALFMALVLALPEILKALIIAFGNLFRTLWEKLTTIFAEFASNFGEKISGVFKRAINGVLAFIEQFINAPIDLINSFADTINNVFGSIGINLGHIKHVELGRMATGGIVPSTNGGRLILAGEGGQDEWVVPESKMASMIQQINEQGGTGGGITINIQGVFATSEAEQRAVAEQIYDRLQEINKTRMGVYL